MKPAVGNELAKLLNLAAGLYQPPLVSDPSVYDPGKLIELARLNRLLAYLPASRSFSPVESPDRKKESEHLDAATEEFFSRRKTTLRELDSILGLDKLLFFKTFYHYPRVTSDLDLLVSALPDTVRVMERAGWTAGPYCHGNIHLRKDERIKVGVHETIAWGTTDFMDRDLPWRNRERREVDGIELSVAGKEAELMAILAHIPFEKLYWDLGELLYVFSIARQADWGVILKQADKFRWGKTLKSLLGIATGLHDALYGGSAPFPEPTTARRWEALHLPLELPLRVAIRAHLEKRAWSKMARALLGLHIRYVISGRKERSPAG